MIIFIDFFSLIVLFVFLGLSADLTVKNIKKISFFLELRVFIFGIILGIITTLPELSLGINAAINKVTALSVGNVFGGIIVILGLVIGLSLVLNKKIKTKEIFNLLFSSVGIIAVAFLLGIDGYYGMEDGLIIIFLYLFLLIYLYKINHYNNRKKTIILEKGKFIQALFLSFVGIILVLLVSHWIIEMTVDLLSRANLSKIIVGAIVFSLGTNLPETIIAITSWKRKSPELSLSHLISSAFTNVSVIGFLAIIDPIEFSKGIDFYFLGIFLFLTLILFTYFCFSQKKLEKKEGYLLLIIYFSFLIVNLFLLEIF